MFLAEASSLSNMPTNQASNPVTLVSMPFGPTNVPSIGLGLLKSGLSKKYNIGCDIKYYNLLFADKIGCDVYLLIERGFPITSDLLGEWIFSNALFPKPDLHVEAYVKNVIFNHSDEFDFSFENIEVRNRQVKETIFKLKEVVSHVDAFLDFCVEDILKNAPSIVGFTSVFQQQLASLCLAKRLKQRSPEIKIVFGGANVEGLMGKETIAVFDFIDYVVSGEGDIIFPNLVNAILNGKEDFACMNLYSKHTLSNDSIKPTYIVNMDDVPTPNYDDYFLYYENSSDYLKTQIKPEILFESSRGCWWGELHHCTFCGLNGGAMKHRSKSYQRVLEELKTLTTLYPGHDISVVDNILDMSYFKTLIPLLISSEQKYSLFYEVKANLKKEQIKLLSDAGISKIQPGIESLSNSILRIMNKGVSALQNVQLLKWSKEYGVAAIWNLLSGFPKEDPNEYIQMAELSKKLFHLRPPTGPITIRIDRFSPNYNQPLENGFAKIFPYLSYNYVYNTLDEKSLGNLAYFFDFESNNKNDVVNYTSYIKAVIKEWTAEHENSDLFYLESETIVILCDFRTNFEASIEKLNDWKKAVFIHCDKAATFNDIFSEVKKSFANLSSLELQYFLEEFVDKSLFLFDDDKYLSLAVKVSEYYSPSKKHLSALNIWIENHILVEEEA